MSHATVRMKIIGTMHTNRIGLEFPEHVDHRFPVLQSRKEFPVVHIQGPDFRPDQGSGPTGFLLPSPCQLASARSLVSGASAGQLSEQRFVSGLTP